VINNCIKRISCEINMTKCSTDVEANAKSLSAKKRHKSLRLNLLQKTISTCKLTFVVKFISLFLKREKLQRHFKFQLIILIIINENK